MPSIDEAIRSAIREELTSAGFPTAVGVPDRTGVPAGVPDRIGVPTADSAPLQAIAVEIRRLSDPVAALNAAVPAGAPPARREVPVSDIARELALLQVPLARLAIAVPK